VAKQNLKEWTDWSMERLDFKSIVENTQDITYLPDSEGRIA